VQEHSPDVAAILAQVREEVRGQRQAAAASEETSAARTALERELQRCAEQLEYTRVVSSHWPLGGRTLWGRGRSLVQRVVRRLLRWYINPIVDQQNEFNDVTARTLRLLIEAYGDLHNQATALETGPTEPDPNPAEPEQTGPGKQKTSPSPTPPAPPMSATALQDLVEQRGSQEPPAVFPDIALRTMPHQISQHSQVSAHWPLGGSGLLQRVAAQVQKAIRFGLRWLINPIFEQQNSFNAAVAASIPPLLTEDGETRGLLAKLRARRTSRNRAKQRATSLSHFPWHRRV
jgi:hypothetical protein